MRHLKKRGSHVEIMISFSLFIVFLISTFLMLNPVLEEREDKNSVLNSFQEKVLENISSNLTITIIKIEENYNPQPEVPTEEKCLTFNGGGWRDGENIVVTNNAGERISSNINSNKLSIDWNEENRFLKIYSSPEKFELASLGQYPCDSPEEKEQFSIKTIKTEKYIFESRIIQLGKEYDSSYQELKEYFNFPSEQEFGFSFTNSQGRTLIETGNPPKRASVYSKEIPIIYLNNQSNIGSGKIILKVW